MGAFLARRYAEGVDVQRRDDAPAQFLWRGRLYVVRAVLAHWLEAGVWWRGQEALSLLAGDGDNGAGTGATGRAAGPAAGEAEREFWRVEAGAGLASGAGVYDLCFDWSTGHWHLIRVED
jgi:hypothetical protein